MFWISCTLYGAHVRVLVGWYNKGEASQVLSMGCTLACMDLHARRKGYMVPELWLRVLLLALFVYLLSRIVGYLACKCISMFNTHAVSLSGVHIIDIAVPRC